MPRRRIAWCTGYFNETSGSCILNISPNNPLISGTVTHKRL